MQCFKLKTINLSKLQLAANNDLETEAQINHLNMEGKGQNPGVFPARRPLRVVCHMDNFLAVLTWGEDEVGDREKGKLFVL